MSLSPPLMTTVALVTAIMAMATTSKVPHANPISPWDGDNAPPEVPEAQECLTGLCRRVQVVSTIATWGRRGELTVLGSKGPTYFLLYFFSLMYSYSTN